MTAFYKFSDKLFHSTILQLFNLFITIINIGNITDGPMAIDGVQLAGRTSGRLGELIYWPRYSYIRSFKHSSIRFSVYKFKKPISTHKGNRVQRLREVQVIDSLRNPLSGLRIIDITLSFVVISSFILKSTEVISKTNHGYICF